MTIRFIPISTATAWALRNGTDAYGRAPERAISTGNGTPCRHCLQQVPAGQVSLLLAHRPFAARHPYAETGPIFLCAADCAPGGPDLPAAILTAPTYLLRGYDSGERIVYGTGGAVPTAQIESHAAALLARDDITAVHIRSASNNCYLCKVIGE
ncbi:MAG: DUF1203 domain-containing protein [Paracoccus sp. (in: a-proteobacteria)]|uniref:DUF1203 domain-containing protein n=1 Tax=Paracoccus sp. TaxID=267 RepID=UPI0026DF022B|nr:DUF1203 domain-containing protein [Paracoccus sp. (in: a-proteobacteria)]MDO5633220.1 DUF1203 domain-containing protein [Paracoccus sp. (in: a-proteobacteria)]